ncbi:MAG TPA: (2Fe-2S)-binding protein [Actinocrinis sp.]|jgi:carbon-monoxide dehydrogenase small subunit|uniref:(2Fe-2S)-binding protein n=1 Tax=Actinocrinis sp. TaxID=1920516 RepID=UPI002DDD936E|nr:(2Fe-2S)-binding protein [Actinocrinis sp.]HEV3173325.1 (2Fe-2S)-binding protein [Actinocrinis sp.]
MAVPTNTAPTNTVPPSTASIDDEVVDGGPLGAVSSATIEADVRLTVNGTTHRLTVEARRNLVDVLRRDLGLNGTQVGCDTGACGSCTVLMGGEPVRSCLVLAAQADGASIETVESLAPDGILGPLQEAFREKFALQCGFCTAGFLMLGTALLRQEPDADRDRIREWVSANLCRCTGYSTIIDAIEAAAQAGHRLPLDTTPREEASEIGAERSA